MKGLCVLHFLSGIWTAKLSPDFYASLSAAA
jgi:hypothetical protein